MSALPLAISASFYPPALLVLTGKHPRPARPFVLRQRGAAHDQRGPDCARAAEHGRVDHPEFEHGQRLGLHPNWAVAAGIAVWAWRRKARDPDESKDEGKGSGGRIAEWSRRATTSQRWAFVLGLVMFLPSPLYLLAVKDIADCGDSGSSDVIAVLICAIGVMLFVEIPLVAMFIRPGGVAAGIERFHEWLKRNGWSLAAGLALIGGIYAISRASTRSPDWSGQQGPRQRPVWAMIRPDFTAAASCW